MIILIAGRHFRNLIANDTDEVLVITFAGNIRFLFAVWIFVKCYIYIHEVHIRFNCITIAIVTIRCDGTNYSAPNDTRRLISMSHRHVTIAFASRVANLQLHFGFLARYALHNQNCLNLASILAAS